MTTAQREDGRYVYVPEGFDHPAQTLLEALEQGRALLAEDGRWIKHQGFANPRPQEDPTTPFCNGWGACAIGSLYCVLIGIRSSGTTRGCDNPSCRVCPPRGVPVWDSGGFGDWKWKNIYNTACSSLSHATREVTSYRFGSIVEFNDHSQTTHEQVMAVFDRAIAIEYAMQVEAASNS